VEDPAHRAPRAPRRSQSGRLTDRLAAAAIVALAHWVAEGLVSRGPLGAALTERYHATHRHLFRKDCRAMARLAVGKLLTLPHHGAMVPLTYLAFQRYPPGRAVPFMADPLTSFCLVWWCGHLAWVVSSHLRFGRGRGEPAANAVQSALALAVCLFYLVYGGWLWLVTVAGLWCFFSPLLHAGSLLAAHPGAGPAARGAGAALAGAFYVTVISWGWLGVRTAAAEIGRYLRADGCARFGAPCGGDAGDWDPWVRGDPDPAWFVVGSHVTRAALVASLGLAHVWLGKAVFDAGTGLLGDGPSHDERRARVDRQILELHRRREAALRAAAGGRGAGGGGGEDPGPEAAEVRAAAAYQTPPTAGTVGGEGSGPSGAASGDDTA